jgi:hypothetical protein
MRHRFLILMLAGALAGVGAAPTAPANSRIDTRTVRSGNAFSSRDALTGYADHHHLIAADRTILVRSS